MLKENDLELKFELLKIILSNPAININAVDADIISEKLSKFVQAIRKPEPQPEAKP